MARRSSLRTIGHSLLWKRPFLEYYVRSKNLRFKIVEKRGFVCVCNDETKSGSKRGAGVVFFWWDLPDISSTSTYSASSFSVKVAFRDSGVMPDEVAVMALAAAASGSAAALMMAKGRLKRDRVWNVYCGSVARFRLWRRESLAKCRCIGGFGKKIDPFVWLLRRERMSAVTPACSAPDKCFSSLNLTLNPSLAADQHSACSDQVLPKKIKDSKHLRHSSSAIKFSMYLRASAARNRATAKMSTYTTDKASPFTRAVISSMRKLFGLRKFPNASWEINC